MIEIPGYTLRRQIGQGGMAVVYLAEQQSLGREVALKILSSTLAEDAQARERFVREARTAAKLHHPHIVPIYDVGTHEGVAYIAMEFEPGGTAAPVVGAPREVRVALGIVREIALALDYAHGQGVVHRDIKPENILCRVDGTCMLSDFGIARVIESTTVLTREGTCVGTPQYMSPEQLRGDKVDGRADLYSLGVVLYQLLTGALPYDGSDGWAIGLQHLNADIPRLPASHANLQPLLDGLMAKQAKDRPQTGAVVVRQIGALLAGTLPEIALPVAAAPPKTRRLAAWKWLFGPVIAVLAIGAIALWEFKREPASVPIATKTRAAASVASQAMPTANSKSIAVLPFENLSEDKANAYFSSGMRDEILTRLAGLHGLKVISRTSTEQYGSRPANLKLVAEQLGVAVVLEGSVQKADDQVHINVQLIDAQTDAHLWAESYDRDLKDIFGIQRDVAEKVAAALKAQLLPEEAARLASIPTQNPQAYDLYLRARAHFNRDDDQRSVKEQPRAIALYRQALLLDPRFALAAAALARSHMQLYWFGPDDRTKTRLAAVKAAAEQALALQPDLGEAHLALAQYHYLGHRDYATALQQLQLAGKALPNSADVELLRASIARRQGQWERAIAGYRQTALLDPRRADAIHQLGYTYARLRRYAEADRAFAQAAALGLDPAAERARRANITVLWKGELAPLRAALSALVPGSDDYKASAGARFGLAWMSRDYPAAIRAAQEDVAANWEGGGNAVLPRRLFLARAYAAAGDSAKAKPLYAAVREQMRSALREHPGEADLHLALGMAAAGLGLREEAVREGRQTVALMPVSRDAISGAAYLHFLAQIHMSVGENEQALQLLEQLRAMPAGVMTSPGHLKLDPVWDPLRSDPRFQKLSAPGNPQP